MSDLLLRGIRFFHSRFVMNRRAEVLSNVLSAWVPSGCTLLDVGCGDGQIGSLVSKKANVSVTGVEFRPRPGCRITCRGFDGLNFPAPDQSYDVCMLVDVLHHSRHAERLLREARRISRRYILLKDHLCETRIDFAMLKSMDWLGNRPYGAPLTYNYQGRKKWEAWFCELNLAVRAWREDLEVLPHPVSKFFGRSHNFAALLEKI